LLRIFGILFGVKMKKPLIVVNLKTYKFGHDVLRLCRRIESVSKGIIVGAQVSDIFMISSLTKLKVYSQHVDDIEPGRNTGFVSVEAVRAAGARGVFLNHSEHPLEWEVLKNSIKACRDMKLKTIVFAKDLRVAKRLERLKVDYVCIEPPELVSGKISVSEAKPELIKHIGKNLKCKFLVGAGIHSREDVEVAMKYGASGVALSSAVTKGKRPKKVLKGLLNKK
jgi:triosephosphate isomerase